MMLPNAPLMASSALSSLVALMPVDVFVPPPPPPPPAAV